jgi:hypothetical protein
MGLSSFESQKGSRNVELLMLNVEWIYQAGKLLIMLHVELLMLNEFVKF